MAVSLCSTSGSSFFSNRNDILNARKTPRRPIDMHDDVLCIPIERAITPRGSRKQADPGRTIQLDLCVSEFQLINAVILSL
jgi:hypothetical protein